MDTTKKLSQSRRKIGLAGKSLEIKIIPSPVPTDAVVQAKKKSLFTRLIANMIVSAMLEDAGDMAGAERVWEDSE